MQEFISPPYLQNEDRVFIASPASKIDKKLIEGMKHRLIDWGLKPSVGKHALSKSGTFAGTLKQRVADFQYALDNKNISAIFCSRGGYGSIELLEHLNFDCCKQYPKWLIGYSDITALHNLFYNNKIKSLHAPMARHFSLASKEDLALEFTRSILFGQKPEYIIRSHKLNNKGSCYGKIVGGNLTVVQSLLNTPFDTLKDNCILFLEDVNISSNQVERLLFSMKHSNILSSLNGLIIGQFCFDYAVQGEYCKVFEKIHTLVKGLNIPIAYNLPIGHSDKNYPIINGANVNLEVTNEVVKLFFR